MGFGENETHSHFGAKKNACPQGEECEQAKKKMRKAIQQNKLISPFYFQLDQLNILLNALTA